MIVVRVRPGTDLLLSRHHRRRDGACDRNAEGSDKPGAAIARRHDDLQERCLGMGPAPAAAARSRMINLLKVLDGKAAIAGGWTARVRRRSTKWPCGPTSRPTNCRCCTHMRRQRRARATVARPAADGIVNPVATTLINGWLARRYRIVAPAGGSPCSDRRPSATAIANHGPSDAAGDRTCTKEKAARRTGRPFLVDDHVQLQTTLPL